MFGLPVSPDAAAWTSSLTRQAGHHMLDCLAVSLPEGGESLRAERCRRQPKLPDLLEEAGVDEGIENRALQREDHRSRRPLRCEQAAPTQEHKVASAVAEGRRARQLR